MASDPSPPPRGAGLSLYANLLEPSTSGATITAAPVSYREEIDQDDAAKKQQSSLAASLRFQPTKRPQKQNAVAAAAKAKAKAIATKLTAPISDEAANAEPPKTEPTPKTTIADWTATTYDDEWNMYGEKRQRGGRKRRKKNKEVVEVVQDWDDIYDPSRPNNYEEYKHSEEKIREVREWKDLLYRHRMRRRDSSRSDSEESKGPINRRFAPPMSFAPPSNINDGPPPPPADLSDNAMGEDAVGGRVAMAATLPPPPPPAEVPNDATGEDAYTRRLRLSQQPPPPPPPLPAPTGQITRAPVRYSLPAPPEDIPSTEIELEQKLADEEDDTDADAADPARSNRPGQAGFAERLMSKYGWSKGQGLGAHGTGITNALYAKADKRKKKADADGGGYATPAGTGRILGGSKSKAAQEEEQGKFGAMSEVIRLENMLDGMDVDEELSRGERGGIMQEIGEECGDKYGSVERVYIHRQESSPLVFVHFVSQLSALRAVNALQGRAFGGNTITARFWLRDKFEAGEYL